MHISRCVSGKPHEQAQLFAEYLFGLDMHGLSRKALTCHDAGLGRKIGVGNA